MDIALSDTEKRIEAILAQLVKNTTYELRKAYGLFFVLSWNSATNGWVIHKKGMPWAKNIKVTSNFEIKTYGRYFPTFSWEIAETLWVNFPKENVTINGQPIKRWSHAVRNETR